MTKLRFSLNIKTSASFPMGKGMDFWKIYGFKMEKDKINAPQRGH